MKFSEILANRNDLETERGYLVFSRYEEPHIRLLDKDDELDECQHIAIKIKGVNIRYLYYYLISHMELFKSYSGVDLKMDHLNMLYIHNKNIADINQIPRYLQDSLVEFMDTFYMGEIEPLEKEIKSLYNDNSKLFKTLTNDAKGELVDDDNIYELFDEKKFIKNVKNGEFPDSIEDYIELLRPKSIYPQYLQYRWYYDDVISDTENYRFVDEYCWYNFVGFNIELMRMKLPPISEQRKIVEETKSTHQKILLLQAEKRNAELILKKITDALN